MSQPDKNLCYYPNSRRLEENKVPFILFTLSNPDTTLGLSESTYFTHSRGLFTHNVFQSMSIIHDIKIENCMNGYGVNNILSVK